MYTDEIPMIRKPDNEDIKIWRYMDFTKFIDILERESIFFTRSDKFEDPFEGALPKRGLEYALSQFEQHLGPEKTQEILESKIWHHNNMKKWTIINCWHMNEYESAAMWKLYLKSNEGIAIQSTFKRLCDSFYREERKVYVGMVKYIDYELASDQIDGTIDPFFYKGNSFEHEKELRALIIKYPDSGNISPFEFGDYASVDLSILIENIYVAPTAPKWITELVKMMLKRYGLEDKLVIQSALTNAPMY